MTLVSCSKYIELFWQRILDLFMDIDTGTLYSFLNNWIIIDLQHSVSSWWSDSLYALQNNHSGNSIYHLALTQSYYTIIDCIPLLCISSYGSFILPLKFCIFFNLPLLYSPIAPSLSPWQLLVCSLYLWVSSRLGMLVLLFCFSDFTYKGNRYLYFSNLFHSA